VKYAEATILHNVVDSLPRYGAVAHGNRLVRTRMLGDVGRGREKLPLTRLELDFVYYLFRSNCVYVQLLVCL
jgi:hypothetical protein